MLVATMDASALELRSYDPNSHDRFVTFPENPSFNASFAYDAQKITGVGWELGNPEKQYALVTRRHLLFATHHAPAIGARIRFLSKSGTIVEREVAGLTSIPNPSGSTSDLSLISLSSAIEENEGVDPLPFHSLTSEEDFQDKEIVVFGSGARAGVGRIAAFSTINVNWTVTRSYRFNYQISSGGGNDARLTAGDSGSPTLVNIDGVMALLGIHLATDASDGMYSNYDAFVPHYIEQIGAIAEAQAASENSSGEPTDLVDCTASVTSAVARQAHPLELDFALSNVGTNPVGHLEVEIAFPRGTAPTSMSADGWVVSGGGNYWSFQRASLASASTSGIRANWSSAPIRDLIMPTVVWNTGAEEGGLETFSIPLGSSFAAWASELPESGPSDDPDRDGRENLEEYALGGNPMSGSMDHFGSVAGQPTFSLVGNLAVFRYPERSDKSERGLIYTVEWSDPATAGSWKTDPPPEWTSTASPYQPEIPGFVERRVAWPISRSKQFVRLRFSESDSP